MITLANFNVISFIENIYSEDIVSSCSLLFRGALSSGLLNWENLSSHLIAYCFYFNKEKYEYGESKPMSTIGEEPIVY